MKNILLSSIVAALAFSATAQAAPNVLVIMADDLNTDVGCYGNKQVKTPNIDSLAAQGVRFERAYCQYPLSGPSRASIYSGLRPSTSGLTLNRHKLREQMPDTVMLPQLFKENGYYSMRVGKIYHYTVPLEIGQNGDDDPLSWNLRLNPKGRDVDDEGLIFSLVPGNFSGSLCWLAAEGEDREQTDGIGANEAIQLLRKHKDKPFFLAVGFYRPHTPFVAPKKYFEMYPPDQIALPVVPAGHREAGPEEAFRCAKRPEDQMTDDLRRKAIQAYWASISFVDAQIGRVLAEVRALNLEKDTIIVFLSDHGYHLGDHGLWQKGSLFERGVGTPLIISVPGKAAGESCPAIVELSDIYPTLAELCGLKPPSNLDGKSLVPLLDNPKAAWDGAALTQTVLVKKTNEPYIKDPAKRAPLVVEGNGFSLRTDRYRYTEWDDPQKGVQLYDLKNDPQEFHNIANDPASASVVAEHHERIKKMLLKKEPVVK